MVMVRRLTSVGLIGGLVLALALMFSPSKASAQMSIAWTTGFQVQNLGQGAATVTIQLINTAGATVATVDSTNDPNGPNPIPQGSNRTYFPVPLVTGAFNGSAIISANQPIAAILNILGNAGAAGQPFYSGSANGISQGATDVRLPLILRNNAGISTWFAVQNVGAADAAVTVQFTAAGAGTSYTAAPVTIKKGASYTFDQSTDASLGSWFVGSAIITSAEPLAVIANQVGTRTGGQTMLTYSGFPATSGSNSVALPMIQQANGGTGVGITVQNAGTVEAKVTITYSANLVTGGASLSPDTFALAVGASKTILKLSTAAADHYVGSALVTTGNTTPGDDPNQKVVAIVNQASSGMGSAYEGINTSTATPNVSLPLLMTNGGIVTGVQCKNLGVATTVTLTYNPNTVKGSTFNPPPFVSSSLIPVNGTVNIGQSFASQYVGGGTITTNPSSPIICIVNQVKLNAGDALLTYDGINY